MTDDELQALVKMYEDVVRPIEVVGPERMLGGSFDAPEGAGPTMWMAPLGTVRALVAEHFTLEELREDVRELVLDADVGDGEIVMITPETVGIIEVEFDEPN